ncbi:PREDICTED: ankyrin-3-like, partial [Amphimedon queenslandica]|uniref:Uncharacterized protein n=1 Tax=Amphimedon queenslandica TaxID=400682 RepID=A0AAN0ISP7_AMPQE
MNTTDIDINITCNEGRTPFNYSCSHGNLELSQYLCEIQGSGINLDEEGYSIRSGNMKLVQYLIENHHLLLTPESLIEVIYSTKLPLVKLLINEYKLDPHVKDEDGKVAVQYVAQVGVIDVLEYLVNDCGCDLGDRDNENIFHIAAAAGIYSIIKYIIDNYPQFSSLLHSTHDGNTTPVHAACGSGVVKLVTFLIDEMKCDDSTETSAGFNCVSYACISDNLDLLKLLIKQYKHNPRIYSIRSSLNVAVMQGHVHILEWLRQEYHINLVSFKNGLLPFLTLEYNRLYCLKHLLNNYSFDINATDPRDDTQSTLLHIALEEHELDLTIKDYNGMAPVHVACEEGSLSIVKHIIDHSPLSLDMTDSFGRTPLLIAAFSKNLPIIRYLNSKNCNISILDDKGFNVIHISAKEGSLDILRFFVDGRYCNPDITDASGRTPLYLSAQEGHLEIVEYLLDSPSYNKPRVELVDMADSN